MRLTYSSAIEKDVDDIAYRMSEDSPARANRFVRGIHAEFRRIAANPFAFQLRPDLAKDARLAVFGSYVILFRVLASTVKIERVVFGGRDLPPLIQ